MELSGLRGSNNPKAILSSLLNKRQKLQDELRSVEKQVRKKPKFVPEFEIFILVDAAYSTVYELETSYLQETTTFGNALKGYDGFLSSSKNTSNLKRSRKFQLEDRVFSLSSVTSPAAEELSCGKEDGKVDIAQCRPKTGGLATTGQGKPKKGRTSQREVKRMRLSGDLDPDDEDDLDLR